MIELYNEDCLEGMKRLADNSIDCIVTDLPYSMTACAWDLTPIDLAAMWKQFNRVLKPCCSTVLFASGKFTYKLITSNFDRYKYKWIWVKNAPTFFVHAKNAPMRKFEEILVFSDGSINHATCTNHRMKYNPQGLVDCTLLTKYAAHMSDVTLQGGKLKGNWARSGRLKAFGNTFGKRPSQVDYYVQKQTGYPSDVLFYDAPHNVGKFHPSQKPVDLLEFLIKTYTDESETVLDATMGSGSTGVACVNTNRNFVGFELERKFFDIARKRIDEAKNLREQSLFNVGVAT